MDLEEDVHWSHISVDFKGDATCSAVATYCNVACVISQRFLYVIRLRNLVFERKESVPTRVRAPTVAQGKKLTSAVIYGQHLYIAETPATNRKLVLHATNFNDLLLLDQEDAPIWNTHSLPMNQSVTKHIGDTAASVSLFITKLNNPEFTKDNE